MAANSKVIALLSACLSLGTSGALAALAIERDRAPAATLPADTICPPGACTIAIKTADGGAPSVVYHVPAPASAVRPAARPGPVVVAAAEPVR